MLRLLHRVIRIALATAGLCAVGALTGAVAFVGVTALALLPYALRHPEQLRDLRPLLVGGAMVGAEFGAVAAPVLGWLFLRRTPLGHAYRWLCTGSALGALVVAGIGAMVAKPVWVIVTMPAGATVGLIVTSVRLWGRDRPGGRLTLGRVRDLLASNR